MSKTRGTSEGKEMQTINVALDLVLESPHDFLGMASRGAATHNVR